MPPATAGSSQNGYPDDAAYPSRTIAFQAAGMITSIVEALQAHDELRFTPAFMYVLAYVEEAETLIIAIACTAYSLL